MIELDPTCKHGTRVAQTQCKACMNDELIELRSKLDALRADNEVIAKRAADDERRRIEAESRLGTIRDVVKRILGAGYIDEHSRDWERGDGFIAELMCETDGAVEKQNPCPYCGGDDRTKCPCDGIF